MKKAFLITVCFAILFAICPVAYSADDVYVSGSIGFAKITDMNLTDRELFAVQHKDLEPDEGLALAVAMGYRVHEMLRLEGEVSYQENDVDQTGAYNVNGDVSSFAIMANGYFEPGKIEESGKFQPYITFGIGWAKVDNDFILRTEERYDPVLTLKYDNSKGGFAYQAGAGVGYAINEKITFDCKYRFMGVSDLNYGTSELEYSSHNIFVGIRYAF